MLLILTSAGFVLVFQGHRQHVQPDGADAARLRVGKQINQTYDVAKAVISAKAERGETSGL
jgi:hypothetical protein